MFTLFQLISIAKEACDAVYSVCPLGSSNRRNGERFTSINQAQYNLSDAKANFSKIVDKIENNCELSKEEKQLAIIKELANVAEISRAGNCQEMAAIAFLFLIENKIAPIEFISMPNHVVIVIGRDFNTSLADIHTWNKEVVVCDPWRRKYKESTLYEDSMVYSPEKLLNKLQKQEINMNSLEVIYSINSVNAYQALELCSMRQALSL